MTAENSVGEEVISNQCTWQGALWKGVTKADLGSEVFLMDKTDMTLRSVTKTSVIEIPSLNIAM